MLIEHIMVFERPTIEVICDIFGCPEDTDPFPPLIWQITQEEESRLFVYYIGDGRIEGLERQLLFKRQDNSAAGDVEPLSVEWLHFMLEDARPSSAVLMLDTSFSPRPLPCADEDPGLIDDALLSVRSVYRNVMRAHWNRSDVLELSATTPVQPPHCDRFDQVLDDLQQPLFTKFLLKAIVEGEADKEPFGDDDRLIDLGELEAYLDDHIKRAARFQWGRLQNVLAVGSRSKVLASLDGRKLSDQNEDVVARRNRPPGQEDGEGTSTALSVLAPETGDGRQDQTGDGQTGGAGQIAGSGQSVDDDQRAAVDQHVAVDRHVAVDQQVTVGGQSKTADEAPTSACPEEGGVGLCTPDLSTTTEAGVDNGQGSTRDDVTATGGVTVRPVQDETSERSAVCAWVAGNVAPYAVSVVQSVRGDTDTSCNWALDRSEIELGPFAKIFTPIAWRLGRETVQDALSCLLDCGGPTATLQNAAGGNRDTPFETESTKPTEAPAVVEPVESPFEQSAAPQPVSGGEKREPPVDPRSMSAFNREICDQLEEPLPPYIGLPRWMPGTLIISEALRARYGCAPPPAPAELPTPIAVMIEPPEDLETPAIEEAPALATADRRLSRWPPSTTTEVRPEADVTEAQPRGASGTPDVPGNPNVSGDLDASGDSDVLDSPDASGDPDVSGAPNTSLADATPTDGRPPAERPESLADETASDEKPFDQTKISRVRWLQSALTVDNRHPGPIDGIIGRKTEAAIRSWRQDNERESRTGPLTEPEFKEIIRQFGERFGQIEERIESF
ncbi:MAG: hypothetical protein AAGC99_19675 [Pseudomonadota bacterium]